MVLQAGRIPLDRLRCNCDAPAHTCNDTAMRSHLNTSLCSSAANWPCDCEPYFS